MVPDYTEYNFIRTSMSKLILVVVAAWITGGFYEEIVFRGYIQSIFDKWLKTGSSYGSVVITGILFALYHWQQGLFGVIAAFLGGMFWGVLYRQFGNNLWIPILSHAIFDTVTLIMIYTDLFGNLYR